MLTRQEATARILAAKQEKGVTFEEIAKSVGRHKVWVTSALLGQATMSAQEAAAAVKILGLDGEVASVVSRNWLDGGAGHRLLWPAVQ